MKCSLGSSNFLEEISSLSHSVLFLYFFALITKEGFPISSCYSLELCIQMLISFFLLCFSLLSFSQLFIRPPQTAILLFCISFPWGWSRSLSPVQCHSVIQLCLTLCDPMHCSTTDLSVHHQLPEFTETHVHWVGDAIQLSHLLSPPSPTFNLSQHQGLFKWVSSSHQVAKGL